MYQKHELFGELSSVDITETLKACTLEQKDEYMEDEVDRFRECRALIEQGKTYKQAAAQFRKQDKLNQTNDAQPDANELEISELLALASDQVGKRISLIEVGKILSACNLQDKDQYSAIECEVFVEACTLVKQQGKTYQEVAAHFGVAQEQENSPERQQLLAQVQSRVQNSMLNMSSAQALQMRQRLAEMSLEQLEAMQIQFYVDLERELREYVESGQMQAEFEAAAKTVIKQPLFDWSLREVDRNQLNGEVSQKSLPSS